MMLDAMPGQKEGERHFEYYIFSQFLEFYFFFFLLKHKPLKLKINITKKLRKKGKE